MLSCDSRDQESKAICQQNHTSSVLYRREQVCDIFQLLLLLDVLVFLSLELPYPSLPGVSSPCVKLHVASLLSV